ncbi:UPF0489 protein C5orf22 homolog [Trichonephila inaurata madagascariensis]|uniref:UPF0489 protein C5orf22 homolog n=1 Tax=Trichonephila inaurata madagascariensis TaxID=2747483 RepID=A0A8X6WNN0_9ARAC|nr:UPF0489 protein C5orf22 homolog [Trichonephila inaurata madagascariensis]
MELRSSLSTAGSSMSNNMESSPKKKKMSIPVIIVEDHNEVLYHIYRAIGSKKISFENGLMIHFDSHPDLVVPKHLDAERIFEKDYVINCLSIENWIIPAVYAGHFNTVVWMKPVWASQLDDGLHNFKIGVEKTSKEIKKVNTYEEEKAKMQKIKKEK